MKALGMIETYGFIGSVEAADVMLKCADVTLVGTEKVSGGLYYISVTGDVGAVKTAVEAASEAVKRLGVNHLKGAHVIPRPDGQLKTFHQLDTVSEDTETSEIVTVSPEINNTASQEVEVVSELQNDFIEEVDESFKKAEVVQEAEVVHDSELVEPITEKVMTFKEYKRKLDRKRASELRDMVALNPHIEVSEEALKTYARKDMIGLLLEDYKAQQI